MSTKKKRNAEAYGRAKPIDYMECVYPVPPVCTVYWSVENWKTYADNNCANPSHSHKEEQTENWPLCKVCDVPIGKGNCTGCQEQRSTEVDAGWR